MPTAIDELNVTTTEEIYPDAIENQFFRGAPLLAYLRQQGLHPFGGGSRMQNAFQFRPAFGGAWASGDTFNIVRTPSLAATTFLPKLYYSSVVEYKELLQVFNTGPHAVFSIVDADMRNALQTINAIIAIALYNDGSSAARTKHLNGMAEIFNDGITNSWNGELYTTYGGETRNGTVGAALNSIPRWAGTAAGATGTLTYNLLQETYQDASIGADEPNLGLCNKAAFSYALERLETQQRFAQEQDPYWGATAWKFMGARILKDEYAPSLKYGENHAILGSNLTSSFTSAATPAASSNLPAATSCTVGETFWWINTRTLLFRVTNDSEFGFGFSGFIPSQLNTRLVGRIYAAVNVQGIAPRLNKLIYGIGG